MTQLVLFDQAVDRPVDDELDVVLDLRAGDDAAASCRFCGVLSTAAGVIRLQHGEGTATCAMYVERYGLRS